MPSSRTAGRQDVPQDRAQPAGSATWAVVPTSASAAPYGTGALTLSFPKAGNAISPPQYFNLANSGNLTATGATYTVSGLDATQATVETCTARGLERNDRCLLRHHCHPGHHNRGHHKRNSHQHDGPSRHRRPAPHPGTPAGHQQERHLDVHRQRRRRARAGPATDQHQQLTSTDVLEEETSSPGLQAVVPSCRRSASRSFCDTRPRPEACALARSVIHAAPEALPDLLHGPLKRGLPSATGPGGRYRTRGPARRPAYRL